MLLLIVEVVGPGPSWAKTAFFPLVCSWLLFLQMRCFTYCKCPLVGETFRNMWTWKHKTRFFVFFFGNNSEFTSHYRFLGGFLVRNEDTKPDKTSTQRDPWFSAAPHRRGGSSGCANHQRKSVLGGHVYFVNWICLWHWSMRGRGFFNVGERGQRAQQLGQREFQGCVAGRASLGETRPTKKRTPALQAAPPPNRRKPPQHFGQQSPTLAAPCPAPLVGPRGHRSTFSSTFSAERGPQKVRSQHFSGEAFRSKVPPQHFWRQRGGRGCLPGPPPQKRAVWPGGGGPGGGWGRPGRQA